MFEDQPKVFRIVILIIFGVLIVAGTAAIALFRGAATEAVGDIAIWGTLPESEMNDYLSSLSKDREYLKGVTYKHIESDVYYAEVVDAIAAGRGPDLFLIDQGALLKQADKIRPVSYETLPERTFRTEYIEGAEVFLRPEGTLAIPFSVDPLVMYWNRDLFFANGLANPPQYWDEFVGLVEKLTIVDNNQNVLQAATSLGGYDNVTNAKAVLSTLLLQLKIPVVSWLSDGSVEVNLSQPSSSAGDVALSGGPAAVRFYTEFSDPVRSVYTWNRALPESRQAFLAGDLGVYFGFASEYKSLREANPNLNFDIGPMPRIRGATRSVTYGTITGFAIPKSSPNGTRAYAAARGLTDAIALKSWSASSGLPPLHRTLLASPPTDPFGAVAYNLALNTFTWLDSDPRSTDRILSTMIDDISSGRKDINSAMGLAEGSLKKTF